MGNYLESDEKGKHFPAALDFITETLVADRKMHLEETERLIKNISHMRNVIQRQLSLSCDNGVIETFCLLELIQDCLAINEDKANRFNAVVNLECPATLNLTTDRHQLQQVLINLISNALDAVGGYTQDAGEVRVVANLEFENVVIAVVDLSLIHI